jgi:hypothetical protein
MRYSLIPDGSVLSLDAMQRATGVSGVGGYWEDLFHDVLGAAEHVGEAYVRGDGTPAGGTGTGTGTGAGGGGTGGTGGGGGGGGGAGAPAKTDNTWLWVGVAGLGAVLLFMAMRK